MQLHTVLFSHSLRSYQSRNNLSEVVIKYVIHSLEYMYAVGISHHTSANPWYPFCEGAIVFLG